MSAVPLGFDPLTGRVGGELWSVEAWERDRAGQDAALELVRRSWAVPHVPASQRIRRQMNDDRERTP